MRQSIVNFKQQSDVATSANASLQIINRKAYNELHESNSEVESLRQHLEIAYHENWFSEENVRKVVRECRMKVSEANQHRRESDHKLRVLTNETSLRREREREIESQAMSDNMIKLQEIAELKGQVRKLESMLKTETNTSNEYWQRLQKYVSNDPDVAGVEARPAIGGASHHPIDRSARERAEDSANHRRRLGRRSH